MRRFSEVPPGVMQTQAGDQQQTWHFRVQETSWFEPKQENAGQ